MNKTDIVPASLYIIENNLKLKSKLINIIPELSDSASVVSSGGGREKNGMINGNFREVISILNLNINKLFDLLQNDKDKIVKYSQKYKDSIIKYKNAKPQSPPLLEKVKSVSTAAVKFAKSGFATTPQDELDRRLFVCKGCEWWDSEAFGKTGSCKKCGCSTWGKLRMATEKCPLEKWLPVLMETT